MLPDGCADGSVRKKGVYSRTVHDIVDGAPAVVVVTAGRYVGKDGKSFAQDCGYPPKAQSTPEFNDYISEEFLEDPRLSQKELADKYDVSRPFVSKAVGETLKRLDLSVESVADCSMLCITPFPYDRRTRCYVWGRRRAEPSERALLAILPSCTADGIEEFVDEKVRCPDQVGLVFCPLDAEIVRRLYSLFPGAEIVVREQDADRIVDGIPASCYAEGMFQKLCDARFRLQNVLWNTDSGPGDPKAWWSGLEQPLKEKMRPVWDRIEPVVGEIQAEREHQPKDSDFPEMDALINKFRGYDGFELMVSRVMFLGRQGRIEEAPIAFATVRELLAVPKEGYWVDVAGILWDQFREVFSQQYRSN